MSKKIEIDNYKIHDIISTFVDIIFAPQEFMRRREFPRFARKNGDAQLYHAILTNSWYNIYIRRYYTYTCLML